MILSKQHYALLLVVGVDVGGTKIAAALVDADAVSLHRVRYPTEISSPEQPWIVLPIPWTR